MSHIHYEIPRSSVGADFDLMLFDVSGRRVAKVAGGTAKVGRFAQAITFRGDNGALLRSGVYFLRFRVDQELFWRTVVFTK